MNFLKKLTGGKSAKDAAMGAAKAAGLDPQGKLVEMSEMCEGG